MPLGLSTLLFSAFTLSPSFSSINRVRNYMSMATWHYEVSSVPSTTVLTFRSLYTEGFFGTVSSISVPSMVFVRKPMTRLPFVPEGSKVTMLQDSLNVTDCQLAPISHRHTSLQHNRSPKSTGCLLRSSPAITPTRLSLASCWQLAEHTTFTH